VAKAKRRRKNTSQRQNVLKITTAKEVSAAQPFNLAWRVTVSLVVVEKIRIRMARKKKI
jgi:hypothetical protein